MIIVIGSDSRREYQVESVAIMVIFFYHIFLLLAPYVDRFLSVCSFCGLLDSFKNLAKLAVLPREYRVFQYVSNSCHRNSEV